MTNQPELTPVQRLRAYVAHLEEENRRLRGQRVPSVAAVALQRENAELRRRLASSTPKAVPAAGEEHLTLPEVAQILNASTYEILRDLRDSLPMAVDENGNTVVAKKDVDAYVLAKAQGRSTKRFL